MASQKKPKAQGRLRVKNEPPTMEEALIAAECISSDRDEQLQIAASLLGLEPTEDATIKALKAARPRGKTVEVTGRGRLQTRSVVVVERKSRARTLPPRTQQPPR